MKRLISIILCVLFCLSFSAADVAATSLDENELPGIVIDPYNDYFNVNWREIASVALVGSGFQEGTVELEQVDDMFPNEYYAVTHCPAGTHLSFQVVVTDRNGNQWGLSSTELALDKYCDLDRVNSFQWMDLSFEEGCTLLIYVEFDITDSGYCPTIEISKRKEPVPTRDLIVVAPKAWEKVYAYTWEPRTLGEYPGTRVYRNGMVYSMRMETGIQNLVLSAPKEDAGYWITGDILLEDNGKNVTVIVSEDGSYTVLYDALPKGVRKLTAKIPYGRHSAFLTGAESDLKEEYSLPWLNEYNGLFYTFIHDTTQMVNIACIGNGGAYWETGEIILEPNGEDVGLDLSDYDIKVQYGTDVMSRKITVIPPSSWRSVEVYYDDTDYFGKYPGSALYRGSEAYTTKLPVDLCNFTLNGRLANGTRLEADTIYLEDNGLDATIAIAEAGSYQVSYATIGDVTGDGKLNLGDVARLYAHLRGSNLLTDPTALLHADFTGEGRLNMGDVAKIYAHIRTNSLV